MFHVPCVVQVMLPGPGERMGALAWLGGGIMLGSSLVASLADLLLLPGLAAALPTVGGPRKPHMSAPGYLQS